jgi:hypothetical protein
MPRTVESDFYNESTATRAGNPTHDSSDVPAWEHTDVNACGGKQIAEDIVYRRVELQQRTS